MSGDVVDFTEARGGYLYSELICVKCTHRWYGGRPDTGTLRGMACLGCGEPGGVICTGEQEKHCGDEFEVT